MRIFLLIHIVLLSCFFALPGLTAQDSLAVEEASTVLFKEVHCDNSQIDPFAPPNEKLENYRSDDDFNYLEEREQKPSIIDEIWRWLYNKILRFFFGARANPIGKGILYGAMVLVAVIIILKIIESRISKPIGRGGNDISLNIDDELIDSEPDFDELIAKAEKKDDIKLALRLNYLKVLKNMADREIITYSRDKTNRDYIYEIDNSILRNIFSGMTIYFEYVYYGEFSPTREIYNKVKNSVVSIMEELR